jgi:hypothetical protein
MESPLDRGERMRAVQSLVDRLSSPDLTLFEARLVRHQLLSLLDLLDLASETDLPRAPLPSLRLETHVPDSSSHQPASGTGSPGLSSLMRTFRQRT